MKILFNLLELLMLLHVSTLAIARDTTRVLLKWPNRPFTIHLPPDDKHLMPVVLALHGGGTNSQHMQKITCANGDATDATCLNHLADQEGFIVVYPNGSYDPQKCAQNSKWCDVRTFNAGGGFYGMNCASGYACLARVNDIVFFRDLISNLESTFPVDPARIYVTGISNGGAMAHRLACELSDQITAIAAVAGANQFSTAEFCSPMRPVPVLQIHGLEDPVWPYLGGSSLPYVKGLMFSAKLSVSDWLDRNSCVLGAGRTYWLPDHDPNDGTRVGVFANSSCLGGTQVVHYIIQGGGHTWPDGWDYNPSLSGLVSHEFSANKIIWDFLKRYRIP